MAAFLSLRGIIGNLFQIGKGGPQFKNTSGIIAARNAADTLYATVQGADPSTDDDLVTKRTLVGMVGLGLLIYGYPIDGNLTLSGSTVVTLTRDMYYDTLTIPSGITGYIATNGFELFARTANLSGAPARSIRIKPTYDGGNGTNATNNVTPGIGGTAVTGITSGTLTGGASGTNGGNGSYGTTVGVAGGNTSLSAYACDGGYGGAGGTGGSYNYAGGAGGAVNNTPAGYVYPTKPLQPQLQYLNTIRVYGGFSGGSGGGGGGVGAGNGAGGGGGASGAGAGVMRLWFGTLITDGATAAGAIDVSGGRGGNAGNTDSNGNDGGGGAGGGGGYVELWYGQRTGTAVANLINLSGGAGGTGGTLGAPATYGAGGDAGGQGSALIGNTTTGVVTRYLGNPATVAHSAQNGAPTNSFSVAA